MDRMTNERAQGTRSGADVTRRSADVTRRSANVTRRGTTALVLVISLLGVVFAGVVAQNGAARYLSGQTTSGLAGVQATRTAQLILDGAAAELARMAGTPSHPRYVEMRRRLITAPGEAVDLTDLLPATAADGALSWKRAGQAVQRPIGTVAVESFRATAESVVRMPERLGRPSALLDDERTGLIRLEARVHVTLAGQTVSRTLSECREFKLVVAGPPRPFDQAALVLGDISVLTDAERANQHRAQLLAILDETLAKVESVSKSLAPEVAATLAGIQAGSPSPAHRDRLMPKVPTERASVVGLTEKGAVTFAWLDLAARLEEDVKELDALHDRFLAEAGRAGQDGGRAMLERVLASLAVYNRAATRVWEYQRALKIFPVTGAPHAQVFGTYGERLSAAWYAERTIMTLDAKHPLLADWTSSRRDLTGVFAYRSDAALVLSGKRGGRTVLVVDAPAVDLSGLTAAKTGDLVTVVVSRGRVRLSGRVEAYLIVDGSATVEMAADTELVGGLALQSTSGHRLAGKIRFSGLVPTGLTSEQALGAAWRGAYGLALSPVPLYTEGVRQ